MTGVRAAAAFQGRPGPLLATAVAAVGAVVCFADAFDELLRGTDVIDAFDVRMLYRLTQAWFAGDPLYSVYHKGANYPPASWLLLWPVFGWPSAGTARALWAGCHLAALLALAVQGARAIRGLHPGLGLLLLVAPWSMPAITHAVSLGQTAVIVLPLAIGGILLAKESRADWRRDLAAAALFNLALLKPSGTGPLFAVLAIVPGRVRPALLTVCGYLSLTLGAAWFQPEPLSVQIAAWLHRTERLGGRGYGSLQNGLFELGRSDLFLPLAVLPIAALGAWVWRCRRSDVWTLIGASALVARLWVYHRVYDDVLAFLALIAVARIALAHQGTRQGRAAAALLMLLVAILWMPVSWHYDRQWGGVFNASHLAAYLVTLVALCWWGLNETAELNAGRAAIPRPR